MTWDHVRSALGRTHGAAQAVLIVLAVHANEQGKSWPSLATIAREAGLARSTVQAALKKLLADGLVSIATAGIPRAATVFAIPTAGPPIPIQGGGLYRLPVSPIPAAGTESLRESLRETSERGRARDPAGATPRWNGNPSKTSTDPAERIAAIEREMRERAARLETPFQTPEAPGTKITPPVASGNGLAKHIPTEAERLLEIERRRTQAGLLADAAEAAGTRKG